jgi:hypothetical protein
MSDEYETQNKATAFRAALSACARVREELIDFATELQRSAQFVRVLTSIDLRLYGEIPTLELILEAYPESHRLVCASIDIEFAPTGGQIRGVLFAQSVGDEEQNLAQFLEHELPPEQEGASLLVFTRVIPALRQAWVQPDVQRALRAS